MARAIHYIEAPGDGASFLAQSLSRKRVKSCGLRDAKSFLHVAQALCGLEEVCHEVGVTTSSDDRSALSITFQNLRVHRILILIESFPDICG